MFKDNKIGVIIAAAGIGKRMGSDIPKQFMKISGEPILVKTYKAFAKSDFVDRIFVVTNEEYMEYCRNLMVPYLSNKELIKMGGIIEGGTERQDSVFRALLGMEKIDPNISHVLIHDGARPFVTQEIIEKTIIKTVEVGAAIVCVMPKDTIRSDEGTLDRSKLKAVQTPQGFVFEMIKKAHANAFEYGIKATDDASLVEIMGQEIAVVTGDYSNIKITTREDLPKSTRVGHGYDVHKLVEGRDLILGGVNIPYEKGLLGHSDADVLTHALMDALLGAACLGDIGRHFPDSDDEYKGVSSIVLLQKVGLMLLEKGANISNVDITLMAERPKIANYIDEMTTNIAKALLIEKSQINIKGTTTEKLGFVGRHEGMAAEAVCLIDLSPY
ncbi:MAG: 2-C-methyl-D-erythritol 4-phosphate cytidylyltransferase [Anaerovoracaceae bacterium]